MVITILFRTKSCNLKINSDSSFTQTRNQSDRQNPKDAFQKTEFLTINWNKEPESSDFIPKHIYLYQTPKNFHKLSFHYLNNGKNAAALPISQNKYIMACWKLSPIM